MPRFLRDKRGVIPLVPLIIVGIAVLAAGAYLVNQGTQKTANTQTNSQAPAPSPTAQNSPQKPKLETSAFTTTPGTTDGAQGFSFFPPAGWTNKPTGQTNEIAYFVGPQSEADTETVQEASKGYTRTSPGELGIFSTYVNNGSATTTKKIFDYAFNSHLKEGGYDPSSIKIKENGPATINGEGAYKFEFTAKLSGSHVPSHVYGYFFYKESDLFSVIALTLDSAWPKRSATIKASMDSFSFTK